jgi:hypothetical protein
LPRLLTSRRPTPVVLGKGGHIRTVPIPLWVKAALDQWTAAAGVTEGRIFRAVARMGKVWGKGISQNVVWYVVKTCCERAGLEHIAPHDLRRTCAKLCHTSGGELEQIQFLLGHASVQTTERYLGCKQNLGHPVNDLFDLRTAEPPQETGSLRLFAICADCRITVETSRLRSKPPSLDWPGSKSESPLTSVMIRTETLLPVSPLSQGAESVGFDCGPSPDCLLRAGFAPYRLLQNHQRRL